MNTPAEKATETDAIDWTRCALAAWPGLVAVALMIAWPLTAVAAGGASVLKVENGFPSAQHVETGKGMTALQAMMWKYTARCALRADQELTAPAAAGAPPQKFAGAIGVAPEWYGGTCDGDCREKVSACLFALSNRTGKHVALSMLSSAAKMTAALQPSENDLGYPHQEGAFFGNVFAGGEAYACQGTAVGKAAQVKRFCASDPGSCNGLAHFADAGRCADVCQMTCSTLSDGTQRCAASSCRDPSGHVWSFPITTYLRNQLEANNADQVKGATVTDDGLTDLADGATATFRAVDFGVAPAGSVRRLSATLATTQASGRQASRRRASGSIEVWLDGGRLIGTLPINASDKQDKRLEIPLRVTGISGSHDVTLKFFAARSLGLLSTIELR